jgi:hypothetical protein
MRAELMRLLGLITAMCEDASYQADNAETEPYTYNRRGNAA